MAARKNINAAWSFTKDAVSVAEGSSVLAQGNWEVLDLPHTWNGTDGQDGGNDYYRGTCYYAKKMKKEEEEFSAVMRTRQERCLSRSLNMRRTCRCTARTR